MILNFNLLLFKILLIVPVKPCHVYQCLQQLLIHPLYNMLYLTQTYYLSYLTFNPLTAKLFNLNFRPLEVVSRCRDPQLQVSENYSDLTK